jgi:coenzyme F420-dependent glucose-6-phosphate dehydrogenase
MICFHTSHEQFTPSRLLNLAVVAGKSGFDAIHSSDPFHPASKGQSQSGYSFAWLGAALQGTSIPFSVSCAMGRRYHPVIIAQAIATLGEMFSGRFDVELSGDAGTTTMTGQKWLSKNERNKQLLESVDIIRKLLKGEEITYRSPVNINQFRLYSLPAIPPLLFSAAESEETCAWSASWCDGLLTTGNDLKGTEKKINAFRNNGGSDKPVNLQICFSYAKTNEEAAAGAYEQCRTNLITAGKISNGYTFQPFNTMTEEITIARVKETVKLVTSISDLFQWIEGYKALQPAKIILHNIHADQELFIREYGRYYRAYK